MNITYQALQHAIERCITAHPASGRDLVLHPDASVLCDILGEMIYRRLDEIPEHVVQGEHRDAFERWAAPN
jgi:hypothetical protein